MAYHKEFDRILAAPVIHPKHEDANEEQDAHPNGSCNHSPGSCHTPVPCLDKSRHTMQYSIDV